MDPDCSKRILSATLTLLLRLFFPMGVAGFSPRLNLDSPLK
jgi:hypothetical protein